MRPNEPNDLMTGAGPAGRAASGGRIAWLNSTVPLLALLVTVGLVLPACSHGSSGPGVASAGSSTSASSSTGTAKADPLAYSKCMRAHGLSDFPDPDANGGLQLGRGDLDPRSPTFQAAERACKSLDPKGNESSAERAQNRAAWLNYAQCMRAHGLSDFPDPDADGTLELHPPKGSDLDPNNPHFKTANNTCMHLAPNGTGAL